jgi:hypothetical protein
VIATSGPSPHQQIAAQIRTRESSSSDLKNSTVSRFVRFFIPVRVLSNSTKSTIRMLQTRVQNSSRKSSTKLVARTKMKINLAVAAIVILGGLASVFTPSGRRPSVLSTAFRGVPPEPPSTIKGNANTSIPWMEAIQFIAFGRLATIKRVLLGGEPAASPFSHRQCSCFRLLDRVLNSHSPGSVRSGKHGGSTSLEGKSLSRHLISSFLLSRSETRIAYCHFSLTLAI